VTAIYMGAEAVNVSNYPTNCTLYRESFNSGSLGYGTAVACAETALATFDPGNFTISAAQSGSAATLILKGFP